MSSTYEMEPVEDAAMASEDHIEPDVASAVTEGDKKQKVKSKKTKKKSRITQGDGRMPLGYDPALLPTLGDKIVAHKAGRKGQAKANAAPLALPLAAGQASEAETRQAELAAKARRAKLVGLLNQRIAQLAFKGGCGRTASSSQLSSLDGVPTSPSHRRARSSEAVMTSLTQAVRRTALPTVAKQGDSEDMDGTSAQGGLEGHEQAPFVGVPEQEEMEEAGDKANTALDVIVSTDQPIKLATNGNAGLVSPRGCVTPIDNLASSEDIVRQASSSGATEQAPMVEGIEGAREDDLQEQEGTLDVAQEEEGGTQQEELPASSVDMSDSTDMVVVEKEGEGEVEVTDGVPQEQEHTASGTFKEKVVQVIVHIAHACSSAFKTVAATASTAWGCICASCSAVAEATLSVCQGVYETFGGWATLA